MNEPLTTVSILGALNMLAGGLFLLTSFGIIATRQSNACLNLFIMQSLLLAASAFLLGFQHSSWDLVSVGVVNLIAKPLLIPWIMRRTVHEEVYTRREIVQAVNIPTSLLIALAMVIFAYFISIPLQQASGVGFSSPNVPLGFAALLLGAYTLTVRREAVPMLIGLLAMENGAFFVGIAIARGLPLLVEVAIVTDALIVAFITAVLIRAVHRHAGTTAVGKMAALKEETEEKVSA